MIILMRIKIKNKIKIKIRARLCMLAKQKCIFGVLGKKKCIFLHGVFVRSTMCYQCDNVLIMCYQHRRAPVAHSQGQVRVSLVSVNEVYF